MNKLQEAKILWEQLRLESFCLTIAHRFSIGLGLENFLGQSNTFIPDWLKKFCIFFEQWQGARSCWKIWPEELLFDGLGIKYLVNMS